MKFTIDEIRKLISKEMDKRMIFPEVRTQATVTMDLIKELTADILHEGFGEGIPPTGEMYTKRVTRLEEAHDHDHSTDEYHRLMDKMDDLYIEWNPDPSDETAVLYKEQLGQLIEEYDCGPEEGEELSEVTSDKQRRFMCAMKDKSANERPEGLSQAEAEEMCYSKVEEK